MDYLVFIQDSEGQDRSLGKSSVSGLKVVSLDPDQLDIEIKDVAEYPSNDQVSYTTNVIVPNYQDGEDFWLCTPRRKVGWWPLTRAWGDLGSTYSY